MASSSPSRFSFRQKSSPTTFSSSLSTSDQPLSAKESLLRAVARGTGGRSANVDVPTISIHGPTDNYSNAGRDVVIRSSGDQGFEELLHPKVAYPVKTMGVPTFRHEEFGWCANPDFRYTSQVRVLSFILFAPLRLFLRRLKG